MTAGQIDTASLDDRLLPFLPMLYMAWADGDLTDTEIEAIQRHVRQEQQLDPEDRDAVARWLDPTRPPDPHDLQSWIRRIRLGARDLEPRDRLTLAELGLAIARVDDGETLRPEIVEALREVEQSVGVRGVEASRQLLEDPQGEVPGEADEEAPRFDVGAMTRALYGERLALRRRVFEVARPFQADPDWSKDVYREKVLAWVQAVADAGLTTAAFDRAVGGEEDMGAFATTFEALASVDGSVVVKFGVQFGLFGGSVNFLGTERHHDVLRRASTLELPGCYAMTERGHGSNVRDLETTATWDQDTGELVVNTPTETARKEYIGNAACHAQMATVYAQLIVGEENHGVHAVLVPIRTEGGEVCEGVRIGDCGHKVGLNGVDNGIIWFDHVRVPRENLLNKHGDIDEDGRYQSPIPSAGRRFFTMLSTLVAGRVNVAIGALGASKVAVALAVRYGARRRQFGPPGGPEVQILDYSIHQRRLMPLLAQVYATHFAMGDLVARYTNHTDEESREIETLAAGMKAYATTGSDEILQMCRECCGGRGYMTANRIGPLRDDTDVFSTFEGDNIVLLQLVARGLLTAYKRQFNDMNLLSLVRYAATQASSMVDKNPITARRTDEEHLLDLGYHLDILDNRYNDLIGSVARRLKKRLDAGVDSFVAFNQCQNHVVDMAQAWVEREIFKSFKAAVEAEADPDVAGQLRALCQLYGLTLIRGDVGWFLENDYVSGAKAKAIRRAHEAACSRVRDQALPLVEALAIPDYLLDVPMMSTA